MKQQVRSILQLGIAFTAVVAFLDLLLMGYPSLNWLALTVVFLFVAVMILDLLARHMSHARHQLNSNPQREDDLHYFEGIVDRAINEHDQQSGRILYERLRSIALGAVAARTRQTKKEILEIVEKDPEGLQALVKNNPILGLIVGDPLSIRYYDSESVEELLSRIEAWSQ